MTKTIPRKVYIVITRCKWCASRWYWTSNCLNFSKIQYNYIKLMVFCKVLWWCPQVDNEFNEFEKMPTSKYLRSWNLRPKLNSTICFWASLLMISFGDLNLTFYTWVFDTRVEDIMKNKSNFSNTLLLLWPDNYGFGILEHFLGPLYHVCTQI